MLTSENSLLEMCCKEKKGTISTNERIERHSQLIMNYILFKNIHNIHLVEIKHINLEYIIINKVQRGNVLITYLQQRMRVLLL